MLLNINDKKVFEVDMINADDLGLHFITSDGSKSATYKYIDLKSVNVSGVNQSNSDNVCYVFGIFKEKQKDYVFKYSYSWGLLNENEKEYYIGNHCGDVVFFKKPKDLVEAFAPDFIETCFDLFKEFNLKEGDKIKIKIEKIVN